MKLIVSQLTVPDKSFLFLEIIKIPNLLTLHAYLRGQYRHKGTANMHVYCILYVV